jgi:3-dehydroquinate synthase
LADLDVLATLPGREMRAGYAEIIKYGLLGDFQFFEWLEANGPKVLAREPAALGEAVARSVEMKARVVAEDETEQDRRALLNLGHTFGHALEAQTGFDGALLHGEAVAVGQAQAFRFSAAQGLCTVQDARRAAAGIAAAGLPTTLAEVAGHPFEATRLLEHMAQDKKAEGGKLTFILARGLGEAFVARDVDSAAVRAFLQQEGAT